MVCPASQHDCCCCCATVVSRGSSLPEEQRFRKLDTACNGCRGARSSGGSGWERRPVGLPGAVPLGLRLRRPLLACLYFVRVGTMGCGVVECKHGMCMLYRQKLWLRFVVCLYEVSSMSRRLLAHGSWLTFCQDQHVATLADDGTDVINKSCLVAALIDLTLRLLFVVVLLWLHVVCTMGRTHDALSTCLPALLWQAGKLRAEQEVWRTVCECRQADGVQRAPSLRVIASLCD
jgi:hypothetical protein